MSYLNGFASSAQLTTPERDHEDDVVGIDQEAQDANGSEVSTNTGGAEDSTVKDTAIFHDYNPSIKYLTDTISIHGLEIDVRLPYRQGHPLLPIFPVVTSFTDIPMALSSTSHHLTAICEVLRTSNVTCDFIAVVHRAHEGIAMKSINTLTLLIQSSEANNSTWVPAIYAIRNYLLTTPFPTLAIEILDHRILDDAYTHPLLPTLRSPIRRAIKRANVAMGVILNASGEKWTSLYFYHRGCSKLRKECPITAIVGVKEPKKKVWWDAILPKLRTTCGKGIEIEFRFVGEAEKLESAIMDVERARGGV